MNNSPLREDEVWLNSLNADFYEIRKNVFSLKSPSLDEENEEFEELVNKLSMITYLLNSSIIIELIFFLYTAIKGGQIRVSF